MPAGSGMIYPGQVLHGGGVGWRATTFTEGGGRLWTVDYEDVPVGLGLD